MEELLRATNCEICDVILDKKDIDHCHDTGVVRGVLCPKCNKALGLFDDNLNIIKKSIKYLEQWKTTD